MMTAIDGIARRLVWVAVAILVGAGGLAAWFAADREAPFEYVGNPSATRLDAATVRLEYAAIRHRACDLHASRYVSDAQGFRYYLPETRLLASQVDDLRERSPRLVRLVLPLPQSWGEQPYVYSVTLRYVCNPAHRLLPIVVRFDVPVVVD